MTNTSNPISKEPHTSWTRYLAWLPIPIFLILISILAWLRIEVVWGSSFLFTSLNIAFLTVIMLFVSILAARSYLVGQSITVLLLGSGTLALGLSGFIAGFSILNDANSNVTIYDTTACLLGFSFLQAPFIASKRTPCAYNPDGLFC